MKLICEDCGGSVTQTPLGLVHDGSGSEFCKRDNSTVPEGYYSEDRIKGVVYDVTLSWPFANAVIEKLQVKKAKTPEERYRRHQFDYSDDFEHLVAEYGVVFLADHAAEMREAYRIISEYRAYMTCLPPCAKCEAVEAWLSTHADYAPEKEGNNGRPE